MQITQADVIKIAKLSRLHFSEEELKKFRKEMNDILQFFAVLQEVDTNEVSETTQVTGLLNVTRNDEIEMCPFEKELLECSPHKIEKNCIAIPRIM
jgi:aspartyl-tRNA(Asn)/glutamyl-tRNA(Gln) amidotransferase subunit C